MNETDKAFDFLLALVESLEEDVEGLKVKVEKLRSAIDIQCCPKCNGLLQQALADTEEK